VKTLDSSAEYEPYERTRGFYLKNGFYPLEVFSLYWNEDNPCLFLVKYIGWYLSHAPLDHQFSTAIFKDCVVTWVYYIWMNYPKKHTWQT